MTRVHHFSVVIIACVAVITMGAADRVAATGDEQRLSVWMSAQSYRPFDLTRLATRHDTVRANINGVDGLFVLDTGALLLINERLQSHFQIPPGVETRSLAAAGAGGAIRIDYVPVDSISIDDFRLAVGELGMTDLNAVTQGLLAASGVLIDGIIGMDVLIAHRGVIDVGRGSLHLQTDSRGDARDPAAEGQTLEAIMASLGYRSVKLESITFAEHDLTFLSTEVRINGHTGRLILDSGAGNSMIHAANRDRFGLGTTTIIGQRSSSGAGGTFGLETHEIEDIALNGMPIGINRLTTGDLSAVIEFIDEHSGVAIDGVIGQDLLIEHEAVIDAGGGQLYLMQPL